MDTHKICALTVGLLCVGTTFCYWGSWKQQITPENIDKQELDLKYQEKAAQIQHKQQKITKKRSELIADASNQATKKQEDLRYKKAQLELEHKKEKLALERK
ncbi:MAG TPA: hypothetical protein VLB80_04070 [Candidatus Babeliales bacterium]|nr:hypothetical protein [Candidatus Babeliales bacterium]